MTQTNPDTDSAKYCLFQRLNYDCQLEILKYLNINDLLEFSKLGEYYKELAGCAVRNKLVHVNLEPTSMILDVLGKYIRRIKCIANCCGFILKTIIDKCTPDIITELQIEIRKPERLHQLTPHTVSEQELALFSNLQTLSFDHDFTYTDPRAANCVMNKMASVALNLKVLIWNSDQTQCKWLRTEHSNDLYEMYVESKLYRISIDALKYLIRQRPQLQAFNFTGRADPDVAEIIGTYLSKHCKSLKVFIFENYNSCVATTSNKVYGFLTSMPNLNVVSLAWPRLYDHPLMSFISQQHGRIKKLEFAFYYDVMSNRLWQLKYSADGTLEISRSVCLKTLYEADFEWFLKNNVNVVQHLENVVEITIGNSTMIHVINVDKLLQHTPNIQTLSISQTQFRHQPVEIRRIVKICEEKYQYRRCHVIVSLEQSREFQVYNKNKVLIVSIDTKSRRKYYSPLD